MFKKYLNLNKLSTFVFYSSIFIFIIGFNFRDNPTGGWKQQFLPNLNGQPLSDMVFLDSLNGFAVTGNETPNDTNYILKTTDGGNNWQIKYSAYRDFLDVEFINSNTGFACGGYNSIGECLFKTTNAGENWFNINAPSLIWLNKISVLNEDTIWTVANGGLDGGVYFTSNGGINWTRLFLPGTRNIYLFNARIGFLEIQSDLWKTTNGGINWNNISNNPGGFSDMYFIDSLTGWKCSGSMKKTLDGGLTWSAQILPSGGSILISSLINFSNVNADTIWGVGGRNLVNGSARGSIYKTTNGGMIWGYQVPDTSISISRYYFINFINENIGWAYHPTLGGVYTTIGGNDTTYYTGIKQVPNYVPENFTLGQNYPNPFNPITSIPFELNESGFVTLRVYDIKGALIKELVNGGWSASKYISEFDGTNLSSAVYFYKIEITGDNSNKRFTETKRMLLLK